VKQKTQYSQMKLHRPVQILSINWRKSLNFTPFKFNGWLKDLLPFIHYFSLRNLKEEIRNYHNLNLKGKNQGRNIKDVLVVVPTNYPILRSLELLTLAKKAIGQ